REKALELAAFEVTTGDIVISRSGTVGEICAVPSGLGTALISTNLMRVSLNTGVIVPAFFVHMFQGGGGVKSQVKALCKGSSREFLNQFILESLAFPVCGLAEQRENLLKLSGLAGGQLRNATVMVPGTTLAWSFFEFKTAGATPYRLRIPDPGAPAVG